MHLLYLICLSILFGIVNSNDLEKYRPLREQCEHMPTNDICLKLQSQFVELYKKCQKIKSEKEALVCKQIKDKSCFIFPSTCIETTTSIKKISSTKRRKSPISKLNTTTKKRKITKPKLNTTISTSIILINQSITNDEFIKVPIDPNELRTRGEYCIRHGKEKKCQDLLNNLKITYSSCSKKDKQTQTSTIKPEQIDCHSFQTHLCKAFPKFPPCIKKTST